MNTESFVAFMIVPLALFSKERVFDLSGPSPKSCGSLEKDFAVVAEVFIDKTALRAVNGRLAFIKFLRGNLSSQRFTPSKRTLNDPVLYSIIGDGRTEHEKSVRIIQKKDA